MRKFDINIPQLLFLTTLIKNDKIDVFPKDDIGKLFKRASDIYQRLYNKVPNLKVFDIDNIDNQDFDDINSEWMPLL